MRFAGSVPNSVILENTRPGADDKHSYIFLNPVDIIRADSLEMVESGLRRIDEALSSGHHAAGFISYEAGFAFEKSLPSSRRSDGPYLWFGVYDSPIVYDHRKKQFGGKENLVPEPPGAYAQSSGISDLRASISKSDYISAVGKIGHYIREGDTYQVNYTFKLRFDFSGDPGALYCRIRNEQHVPYSAFLGLENTSVLSFSPELFFRVEGSQIWLKPMKGTSARGRNPEEDVQRISDLRRSEKNRAENLMIVDLLRNDVGKVAETGSVKVSKLFEVEKYDTVFQATSMIRAKLRKDWLAQDILLALFPSGSVTGAPKIRTMQIIQELEREPRGVYTGAIGFFSPHGKAVFNVAIRTLVLDNLKKTGEMGVGSGIVHDSIPEEEYRECILKAKFVTEPSLEFKLFETIRWDRRDGLQFLRLHLRRMRRSAEYFDFRFRLPEIKEALGRCEKGIRRQSNAGPYRVKLTLSRNGAVDVEYSKLRPLTGVQRVAISQTGTNSGNRFFFHKTTNRDIYDDYVRRAETSGVFDFIFLNERDEVTEGARSNVIIRKDGRFYTPPLSCGVLAGIYREHLLGRKGISPEEKVLLVRDLFAADELFLCNALRGLIKVELVEIHNSSRKHSYAQLLAVEN